MGLISNLIRAGLIVGAPFTGGATLAGLPIANSFEGGDESGERGGLGEILKDIFGEGFAGDAVLAAILSQLGGDGDNQLSDERFNRLHPFTDPRASDESRLFTHPLNIVEDTNKNLQRLGFQVANRDPASLPTSFVQPGSGPINIPGIPFQIGGGLGTDPAFLDRDLLIAPDRGVDFSGLFPLGDPERVPLSNKPNEPTPTRSGPTGRSNLPPFSTENEDEALSGSKKSVRRRLP